MKTVRLSAVHVVGSNVALVPAKDHVVHHSSAFEEASGGNILMMPGCEQFPKCILESGIPEAVADSLWGSNPVTVKKKS